MITAGESDIIQSALEYVLLLLGKSIVMLFLSENIKNFW